MEIKKVGFLGMGVMGLPMAKTAELLRAQGAL